MVHIPSPRHHRRQQGDLEGTKTITQVVSGTSLAIDSEATGTPGAGGQFSFLSTKEVPATFTPTPTPESTAVSSDAQFASSNQIPIGTVIGACVGALAGALILIGIGLFMYKKADPRKNKRGTQRDAGGRPSKSWNKLEDDTWEGKNQNGNGGGQAKGMEMLEAPPHPPHSTESQKDSMEKMFKRSPSVRTEYTIKTDFDHTQEPFSFNFGSHPFAQYHPNLAKELASAPATEANQARPAYANLERAQSGSVNSVAHDSFLSMNSAKRVSGSMSPTVDMAIPTPPTISAGHSHHWESAEVLNFDGESAEIVHPPPPAVVANDKSSNNPFSERRKSENNPFFNSTSNFTPMPSSRSPSTKGKKREITPPTEPESPLVEPEMSHVKVDSISSVSSNDRAIQSLLAALDGSAPSMEPRHPSMQSAISAYSQEDVTGSFPPPPNTGTTQ